MTCSCMLFSLAQDCGYLDNPQNGIVDASGTAFWDTATYRCDDGYQLIGEAARTCEETGLWSGSAPYCAREYSGLHCLYDISIKLHDLNFWINEFRL